MNQLFGYQILPEGSSLNDIVFEGTEPVLMRSDVDCKSHQVNIFAQTHTSLQSYFSQEHEAYIYVWGIPSHHKIALSDIPEWCTKVITEKRYDCFKELLGTFIVIIDEPRERRITFVNDILGIRPMFLGKKNGRIVFGSDVWPIYKAGLCNGTIDYDAVSAWIAYGYNCTDGSLFSDLRRLRPGSVVVFQDGKCTEIPYAEFSPKLQEISTDQASEELHHIILANVKTLLANHSRISISLSGGYDSRYLLAMISSLRKVSFECITVDYMKEGNIANKVAETLGIPLKRISVDNSIWDLYDQVYHFMADGFPISKFVTYCIAQQNPGIPMINGFLGDSLAPVSEDTYLGKYETELKGDLVDSLQCKFLFVSYKILRKDIAECIKNRSRIPMEKAVREGSKIGKIFAWTNFYYRLRYYTSNNFLQHLNITEALLPFYSYDTVAYKMEHDYRIFNRGIYHKIFHTYFPELARIPHASDLVPKDIKLKVARCTKQWAQQLIPIIFNKKWLSLLSKRVSIPVDLAAIAGLHRVEHAVFLFERLFLLEKRVKDTGLDFDWDYI